MYCKNCGEIIPEDAKFCPVCRERQSIEGEESKNESTEKGKNTKKILKLAGAIVGTIVEIVVKDAGGNILNTTAKKAGKSLEKKGGKVAEKVRHKVFVGMKIEDRTPLEKVKIAIKKRRK